LVEYAEWGKHPQEARDIWITAWYKIMRMPQNHNSNKTMSIRMWVKYWSRPLINAAKFG